MMTTMATDSDAPISHPLSTMIAATLEHTIEMDKMANSVTMIFMVDKSRITKAKDTEMVIPFIAFLKKAFSPSIKAQ
jgi:hypothetical protein